MEELSLAGVWYQLGTVFQDTGRISGRQEYSSNLWACSGCGSPLYNPTPPKGTIILHYLQLLHLRQDLGQLSSHLITKEIPGQPARWRRGELRSGRALSPRRAVGNARCQQYHIQKMLPSQVLEYSKLKNSQGTGGSFLSIHPLPIPEHHVPQKPQHDARHAKPTPCRDAYFPCDNVCHNFKTSPNIVFALRN